MTCAELEILLADYVDGTLHAAQKSALEAHSSECAACAAFVQDVTGVTALIGRASVLEPPPNLVTRILFAIPRVTGSAPNEKAGGVWRRISGWFEPVLQPKFAMGMAMTILSFSMLGQFAGIQVRQLKPADLDPARVWATIDSQAQRTWERGMKYYENLKLVYEVQTRLKEWSDQDEQERKALPSGLQQQKLTPSQATPPSPASGTGKQQSGEGRQSK
jgi:hypothetical protein